MKINKGSIYLEDQWNKSLKKACEMDEAELWLRDEHKVPRIWAILPQGKEKWSLSAIYALGKSILP